MVVVEDVTREDKLAPVDGFVTAIVTPGGAMGHFAPPLGEQAKGIRSNRFTSCVVRDLLIADDDEHGKVFNPLHLRLREGRIDLKWGRMGARAEVWRLNFRILGRHWNLYRHQRDLQLPV